MYFILINTIANYENEMEKVSNLQEIIVNLREEISREHDLDTKAGNLKEQLLTKNLTIQELENRIQSIEKSS